MGEITVASKHGIYEPGEIAFLRSVVRERLSTCGENVDQKRAEGIARDTLDAYRRGVRDRNVLLDIARTSASLIPSTVVRPVVSPRGL